MTEIEKELYDNKSQTWELIKQLREHVESKNGVLQVVKIRDVKPSKWICTIHAFKDWLAALIYLSFIIIIYLITQSAPAAIIVFLMYLLDRFQRIWEYCYGGDDTGGPNCIPYKGRMIYP